MSSPPAARPQNGAAHSHANGEEAIVANGAAHQERVVGLAVKPEKWAKHVGQALQAKALAAGFRLKLLDPDRPLEEQGPLDAVLQKLRRPDWEEELERYAAAHPDVKVFDPPAATMPIRHRETMLTMLEGGGWVLEDPLPSLEDGSSNSQPCLQYHVCVPTHTTLREGTTPEAAAAQLKAAGLRYPLLAKPVWADGRAGSHALAVVGSEAGLRQLVEGRCGEEFGLPVVVQQYVDHGGCLFKVYVMGDTAVMVKRNSLQLPPSTASEPLKLLPGSAIASSRPASASAVAAACSPPTSPPAQAAACDQHAGAGSGAPMAPAEPDAASGRDPQPTQAPQKGPQLPQHSGDLELLTRVSAYPRCKSWGKWDLAPKGHGVLSPPGWLIQELAQRLRQHLGLNLFNFDVIVPLAQRHGGSNCANGSSGASNGRAGPHHVGCSGSREGGTCSGGNAEACQQQQQQQQLVYHVIDINYFPGYEKLPGYEDLMVQFLQSIWGGEQGEGEGGKAPRLRREEGAQAG